jgi:CHASE3 domain sensor protein
MTDEPTLGEAMRRLDAVTRQLEALAKTLAEDRRDFASTYVRFDVYEARHKNLDRRVGLMELAAEEKERADAAWRRQLQFIILGAVLAAILSLIVSVVLASGGLTS